MTSKIINMAERIKDTEDLQLEAAVREGRREDASYGVTSAYGRRDVLLEELAAVDPSLAAVAAQHLLGGSHGHQPAGAQHGHTPGQLAGFGQVVGAEQDRALACGLAQDGAGYPGLEEGTGWNHHGGGDASRNEKIRL